MKIYPAIDLAGGEVVRLRQGRFDAKTVYGADPVAVARRYREAGARRMHVVDLDGTRDGAARQTATLARVLGEGPPGQVGGGVRARADVATLVEAGAQGVVVGSLAVRDPAGFRALVAEFGAERMVLAADCRRDAAGVPRILTQGWAVEEALSLDDLVEGLRADGAAPRRLLCTDVDRDGMLEGPAVDLYGELAERWPDLEIQASGGVRDRGDLEALAACGAGGAVVGRALYEGTLELEDALAFEEASGC